MWADQTGTLANLACVIFSELVKQFTMELQFSDYYLLESLFSSPSGLRLEKGVLTSRIFSLVPILARYTWQSSCWTSSQSSSPPRASTSLSTTSRTSRAAVCASSSVRRFYRALDKWTVPWGSLFNCVLNFQFWLCLNNKLLRVLPPCILPAVLLAVPQPQPVHQGVHQLSLGVPNPPQLKLVERGVKIKLTVKTKTHQKVDSSLGSTAASECSCERPALE